MKIITAVGSPELNDSLLEIDNENIEVIGKDIPYQEGILEVLETRDDIDMVVVSNTLPEEMNFLFLIDQIKKIRENIEIIVLLKNEDVKIENFLNSKKIFKIYYLDENGIDVFINSLRNEKEGNGISEEIEILKNMLIIPNIKDEKEVLIKNKDCSLIIVTGTNGSGKSIISCILAKQLEKMKKKVVLVDFANDGSIRTILGTKGKNIKRNILKIVDNIGEESGEVFLNKINELKQKNDFIIIDLSTSISNKREEVHTLLEDSNKVVFLLEPNILEISKARTILEILINKYDTSIDKIKIVFNKTNKFQIDESVLEEVFSDFDRIGNISYDEKYNLFINQHLNMLNTTSLYKVIYDN